ncbi:LysR family transcriptional regulator [Rhodobacterales bacterium HKCCE3408]|nr:LysR family transcriptional regulator [Rhodobacterales bacterium HKCCE3408]
MNFKTLDLNLLRVLDALLSEGSVTRAGEKIGLSQPAVSAALARLRSALGDPLLVRQGQGLVPTDYARSIAPELRRALDGISTLLAGPASYDPAKGTETFRLSGSDFFAELLMPELAHRIGTEAPGVRVQLVDLVPQDYVSSLERYDADLLLIPSTDFPDWIDSQPLFRSTFRVIARSGHPALPGRGGQIDLDTFCALPHVLFSPEGRLASIGDDALTKLGRSRKVTMTLATFYGVARAVAASDAIALVPGQFAEALAPVIGLNHYAAPLPVTVPVITMAWHRRSSNDPAHQWLRGLVAGILTPLNAREAPLP